MKPANVNDDDGTYVEKLFLFMLQETATLTKKTWKRGMFLIHYISHYFHTLIMHHYTLFFSVSQTLSSIHTHIVLIILFKFILSTSDWTSCELYRCSYFVKRKVECITKIYTKLLMTHAVVSRPQILCSPNYP